MWFIKLKFVCGDETVSEELQSKRIESYLEFNWDRKVSEWYGINNNIDYWECTKFYNFTYPDKDFNDNIRDTQLKLKIIQENPKI